MKMHERHDAKGLEEFSFMHVLHYRVVEFFKGMHSLQHEEDTCCHIAITITTRIGQYSCKTMYKLFHFMSIADFRFHSGRNSSAVVSCSSHPIRHCKSEAQGVSMQLWRAPRSYQRKYLYAATSLFLVAVAQLFLSGPAPEWCASLLYIH